MTATHPYAPPHRTASQTPRSRGAPRRWCEAPSERTRIGTGDHSHTLGLGRPFFPIHPRTSRHPQRVHFDDLSILAHRGFVGCQGAKRYPDVECDHPSPLPQLSRSTAPPPHAKDNHINPLAVPPVSILLISPLRDRVSSPSPRDCVRSETKQNPRLSKDKISLGLRHRSKSSSHAHRQHLCHRRRLGRRRCPLRFRHFVSVGPAGHAELQVLLQRGPQGSPL